MERKRGGGVKFEELTIKLDSKLYRLINAVCGGDPKKVNRLIRIIISESLSNKSTEELLALAQQPLRRRKRGDREEPEAE